MQGSIYTSFSEMVIEKWGMTVWNELLEKAPPCSQGMYTNGMQYDDSEIMASLGQLTADIAHKINNSFVYYYNNLSCLADYLTNFFSLDHMLPNSNAPLESASAVLKQDNRKITVQSNKNEGTCFIIKLPIEKKLFLALTKSD